MTAISNILSETSHRPFELPVGQWKFYQEWNRAIFLHWSVPFDVLRKHVPEQLNIESYGGKYYISLVAFTMQKIRPKYLPALRFISDFHEINLRTYVDNGNKKGVYFINIEAEKHVSAFACRYLSGLPYEKAVIKRSNKTYQSKNAAKNFVLDIDFEVKDVLANKTELDRWLTERYCLYDGVKKRVVRYDIHHKEWELRNIAVDKLEVAYKLGDLDLTGKPPELMHYSDGVKVVAWGKQLVS